MPTRKNVLHLNSIAQYHNWYQLKKPQHPLVSVIDFADIKQSIGVSTKLVFGFYCIALKRLTNGKMKYGQQEYDFDEGVLAFMSPNQVISIESKTDEPLQHAGWLLIFHPDFIWSTALATKIKQYDFFNYALTEALHLSDKEENMLTRILQDINEEYQSNIDKFSQSVIIAHLELLLTYSERFYQRQFITRKRANHSVLEQFEQLLDDYFMEEIIDHGLPTVREISQRLHFSPNYLSKLLKTLTGKSTQEIIHEKLIHLAKEKLSTTQLSVNEIAFNLGFEYPQSFSKLFKKKTKLSPLEFRKNFN